MAKRIQRKRTKGWRMPQGAVYVGRPTRWGNPFTWKFGNPLDCTNDFRRWLDGRHAGWTDRREVVLRDIGELRGKDLACWCPLDQPCHADVLLELANKEE